MNTSEYVTSDSALRIIAYIRAFYREQGLGEIAAIDLHVYRDEEMQRRFGHNVAGNANTAHQINSLRQLTPSEFADVLAHEMLHCWMFERNIYPPHELCEGFCELGAYLFMQRINKPNALFRAQCIMDNPDPVYGEGFRTVYRAYVVGGWAGAIHLITGGQYKIEGLV